MTLFYKNIKKYTHLRIMKVSCHLFVDSYEKFVTKHVYFDFISL